MADLFGPFASGPGASLGQDPYLDYLGPMLQADGVNSTLIAGLGQTLQVYGNSSGMQVLMRAGSAYIRGTMYQSPGVTLAITSNSSGSTRIDRVVLRMNRTAHTLGPVVIAGTPGAGAPAITQTSGGSGIWDLPLARVTVVNGAAGINPGDVADERQYLPLRIPIANSITNPLPVDGSLGRFYYDTQVGDLLVTNGTRWMPLSAAGYDSGPQNLGLGTGFTGVANYRQLGSTVHIHGEVTGVGGSGSASLFALPPAICPPIRALSFPAYTGYEFPVVVRDFSGTTTQQLYIPEVWGIRIPSAAEAVTTPASLVPGTSAATTETPFDHGWTPSGRTFSFHAIYPIAGI